MKKLLSILVALLACALASAQGGDAAAMLEHFAGKKVSFNYSLDSDGLLPVPKEGSVVIDGNCFCIKSKALEVWCDGTTRWTVDNEAKEVYIEDDGGLETMYSRLLEMASGVSGMKVSGDSLSGTWAGDEGSGEIKFIITSIVTTEAGTDTAPFVFRASRLGKEWVVTDLR